MDSLGVFLDGNIKIMANFRFDAEGRQPRCFRVFRQWRIGHVNMKLAKSTDNFQFVAVVFDVGVGHQGHLCLLETHASQCHGGGDIGVFGV